MSRTAQSSIAGFVTAAVLILIAPAFLTDGYSFVSHSISESAAQGLPTGWIARTALILSGLAVLGTVWVRRSQWSVTTTLSFCAFGALWIVTGFFSTRSWVTTAPFDALHHAIHSVAASSMAILVLGALALAFTRQPLAKVDRLLAGALAFVATFLPLATLLIPDLGGIFQRLMFFFTYFWFTREAAKAGS